MSRFYFENVERETNIENIIDGFTKREDERFTKLTIESEICVRDLKVLFSQYNNETKTMQKETKEMISLLEKLKLFNEQEKTKREQEMNRLDEKLNEMQLEEIQLLELIENEEKKILMLDENFDEISSIIKNFLQKIEIVDSTLNHYFFNIKNSTSESLKFFNLSLFFDSLNRKDGQYRRSPVVRKVRDILIPIDISKNDTNEIAKVDGILMGCNSKNKIDWPSFNFGKKKITKINKIK
jgi:Skp family chaperone for outer membrane proteins